jgi:D-alanyl-D-alanine carboxypeptidase
MLVKKSRRLSPQLLPLVLLLAVVGCAGAGSTATARRQAVDGRGRPELQRMLDALVTGPQRIAPGVTAYVSGPRGTWMGAAGVANVKTGEAMRPNTRLRLASVSKTWTATLILRLAQEHKLSLEDTVERWLPRLLPYGKRITIRQLLNHTSGIIDSNDIVHSPNRYLGQVKDPALKARLIAIGKRWEKDPGYEVSPRIWVEFAAALPLLLDPGAYYHYSNIGYDVAGLIAARAGHADLATLFRRHIIQPLKLTTAAYDPHSRITGPHAHGYSVAPNGKLRDATIWTMGIGAGGGMISNAEDEARFLVSAMRRKLLHRAALIALKNGNGNGYGLGISINPSGCAGIAYGHNGGLDGYESNVLVSGNGDRVAVLLLNGRAGSSGDTTAFDTMSRLYCAA